MRFPGGTGDGLKGGSTETQGVPPFRENPLVTDPITGFQTHLTDLQWDGHHWVWHKQWDAPYRNEPVRRAPRPHPLMMHKRKRRSGHGF